MRIQHNILAMNAYRNYNTNTSALGKNLEKLSSGYKINRAGDDAAGLAISEKMRAQITGLNAAQKNVKDGISLVKTAEGAMQEIQDMLNRMDYLATQSANGTYDNEVDRANLQKEVDALKTEINRIADSANFNGIKLMDGSLDSTITSETIANYTDGKNNVPILQDIGTDPFGEVGKKTILHKDGVKDAQKVHFEVDLHNTEIVGAHRDTVTVSIAGKDLTLKFDRDASSNTATAGVLKEGKVSADELAEAIKKAWDSTNGLINGQKVAVTATNGVLKFEQVNAPAHSGENVEACKGIQITHGGSNVASKTEIYLTEAQKKALTTSQKVVIGGKEYNLGSFAAAATGVSTSDGTYKVQYDNGKLTVINQAGQTAATTVSIASAVGTAAAPATSAAGSAATAATASITTVSAGSVSSAKITFVDADGNVAASVTLYDGTNAADTGTFSVGGVTYTYEYNSASGAFAITAQAKGVDGNQTFGYRVETTVSTGGATAPGVTTGGAVNVAGGTNQKGATAKYDMSSVSAGTTIEFNGMKFTVGDDLKATLREIADTVNGVSAYSDLYNVTVDDNNLVVESKVTTTAADVAGTVSIKTGGVDEAEMSLTLTPVDQPSSGSGSWNIQTINNKDGVAAGGDQLASTTFKLNSGIVRDGNVLTIGKDTYTFKVGKDSTVTAEGNSKLIDLSSLEEGDAGLIDLAGKLLSQETNSAFTIGYDKDNSGVVSIHEIKGQQDYTNGELGTLDSFDKLVSFISVGDQSVSEETSAGGKALTLQIGDTSDSFNQMKLSIGDMHTKAMGTGKYTDEEGNEVEVTKTIADIDISNQEGAAESVRVIKNAINYVSSIRGDLGATQNRLEHTANNLSVMAENIQDAESTIRDTDVAEEMMAYTKNNILVQSAQAMLAQANAVPQGVLQLLG